MTIAPDHRSLAERLRAALDDGDLPSLGALLHDDVTWGENDTPRGCRNRDDVLRTLDKLRASGVRARVAEVADGPTGIMCHLRVDWPDASDDIDNTDIFQVYLLRGGFIGEIRGCESRNDALILSGIDWI
ncbi:MAG: nuclear transport factor 2 family protein [Acidimicrobiales bacterium]